MGPPWRSFANLGRYPVTFLTEPLTGRVLALVLAVFCAPACLRAQLRPLEPLDWRTHESDARVLVRGGIGVHADIRAAVAGTEGKLLELGNFSAVWTTGRVALEAAGTVQRRFWDRIVFADPLPGTRATNRRPRIDAGDYRVSTSVRLTNATSPHAFVLRFGTRLPTTNNREGLDRDATDFFATLAGRTQLAHWRASVETGLGIYGTRMEDPFEQSDVWIVIAGVERTVGIVRPVIAYTSHADGLKDRSIRGSEDQRELRLGVRFGGRRFVEASYVAGFTAYNPRPGVLLSVGQRWSRPR
jgi:hypothetical protein